MRESDSAESKPVTMKTVAVIVGLCGMLFGPASVLTGAYFSLSTRVTVLEQKQIADSRAAEKSAESTKEALANQSAQIVKMNEKLDRLLMGYKAVP